jgi:hypothetical protein
MVATESSSGVVKSSSQRASGYSSVSSRLILRARRVSPNAVSFSTFSALLTGLRATPPPYEPQATTAAAAQ